MTEDDLFDDCPLCQLLKQDLKNGKVMEIPIDYDPNFDDEFSSVGTSG